MLWFILSIALVVLLSLGVWWWLKRKRERSVMVSIVLMRKAKRGFTEVDVRSMVRRFMKAEPTAILPNRVDEHTNTFIVMFEEITPVFVIDSGRPYTDSPERVARSFEDPRARQAFMEHRAWVSFDVPGPPPINMRPLIYTLLGKLAGEAMDDQTTLIYAPERDRVALPSPEAEAALKSDNPMSVFGDDELNTPVFHTEPDDKRIARAIKEAQSRLPEFFGAFESRGKACTALAKLSLKTSDGNREHIWVEVTSISSSTITGTIANQPIDDTLPRKGQPATAPHEDISDWAYIDEHDQPQGLFVERVLRKS
jgi:uncharacterized protein YegJ (DUF2314 family)